MHAVRYGSGAQAIAKSDKERGKFELVLLKATRGTRRYCSTGATTRRGASTRGQARHKDEINQLDGL